MVECTVKNGDQESEPVEFEFLEYVMPSGREPADQADQAEAEGQEEVRHRMALAVIAVTNGLSPSNQSPPHQAAFL